MGTNGDSDGKRPPDSASPDTVPFPRDEMPTITDPVELEAARVASTFTSPPPAIRVSEAEVPVSTVLAAYAARFGSLQRVPVRTMSIEEIATLSLDHRAGFMLALVDGHLTLETLADVSGMSPQDALEILADLLDRRILRLR